ncbi:MAG: sigma-70 family RNA polymerase sigma factor [Acidobacteria bacterium]|nr:sigma-70 family RNA polymerase sigma factor [Acidobacteriota bacterium]
MSLPQEITQLLNEWSDGDKSAFDKLMPLVYDELHRIAGRYMSRQGPGHTLQTTALIHEAYLKLVNPDADQKEKNWDNRSHFFGVAATAMRHILVDHARSRGRLKRGEGAQRVSLDEALFVSDESDIDLTALDEALKELEKLKPRHSMVVELRFFGGMTIEETADALKVSPSTVKQDWEMARAWLHRELNRGDK